MRQYVCGFLGAAAFLNREISRRSLPQNSHTQIAILEQEKQET